ncbi:ead/Ea22-like family protein [Enterobacter ludwigii]|uniref:ead/Ea22-like family protein n=1 Tax=Enterobacter ludwigii TaxID=299767 RepID=UPI002FD6367A
MSNIDKQALRKAAEKAGADEWRAFIDTKSKTYAVHTPGDNRCGDVVKWAGFDGQQKASNKARYIAAANPANVLALLDELEAAEKRIAELEAREVKLPAEKFCPAEYAGSQLWEETEIWNKAVQSCEDAIRTAGIKVAAVGQGE